MRTRIGGPLGATIVAVVLFAVLTHVHPGGHLVGKAIDDLGQLAAAVVASLVSGWRSRRANGRTARSWLFLSAGTGAWAVGEIVWSYYELIANRQTPFPSVADAGFLLFPVLAAIGLLQWPSAVLRGGARWRTLLDGVLVAGSLFVLSWVTTLGATVKAGGTTGFSYAVSLAYPISDLVLLTLAVVVVANARDTPRSGLGWLALGLVFLAVADSGFAYLITIGHYATGSPVDIGWFGGFLLIAVAAASRTDTVSDVDEGPAVESASKALLPYVPAGIGLGVAVVGELQGHDQRVAFIAATLVMMVLLCRQLLAILDNRRLLAKLTAAEEELRHQAFHDPLTGLANRALFGDRLRHCVELHQRDLRPLAVLYCDLDSFKTINDTLGHDAGDDMLRAAAERLRAATRPGDTVARMGGDEFAILLEDVADASAVAARILDAFTQPAMAGLTSVTLGVSIGIAELHADAAPTTAAQLLRRADTAMYGAKRDGKGRSSASRQPNLKTPGTQAIPR
jgi:diguanylate cyclase (GGDEF)-like protein